MIDYALRRRFSFFDMEPGFDSDGFIQYQNGLNNDTLNELVIRVKELNKGITMDKSLGKGFCIGHSYSLPMVRKRQRAHIYLLSIYWLLQKLQKVGLKQ